MLFKNIRKKSYVLLALWDLGNIGDGPGMLPSALGGIVNPIGNMSSFVQERCSRKRAPTLETSICYIMHTRC